jgi:hypothetical protein
MARFTVVRAQGSQSVKSVSVRNPKFAVPVI